MLKKIKNNKGVDITLIGTAWILLIIVSLCSLFDIYMITLSKESVISYTKACEIYSLAKNFDADKAYENQEFIITEDVRENIINTFLEEFNGNVVKNQNSAVNISTLNASNCEVYSSKNSIVFKVKGINYKTKSLFKESNEIPFFGGSDNTKNGNYVSSSVATKIVFFSRRN